MRELNPVRSGLLFFVPAAAISTAGLILGLPLRGCVLGLVVGGCIAGKEWAARAGRVRGYDALLLPIAGALSAAFVTFLFGVSYLPQLLSAAVFGWGAGLAAAVFLLVFRPRPWWRIVLAALAAGALAYLSVAASVGPLYWYSVFGVAVALSAFVAAVEAGRLLMRPSRLAVDFLSTAIVGAGAGLGFGLLGEWWFHFGDAFGWKVASDAWSTAAVGGLLFGLFFALFARLADLVRAKSGRRWAVPTCLAASSLILGTGTALYVGKDAMITAVGGTRLDDILIAAGFGATVLVSTYLVRTRTSTVRTRFAALCAVVFSFGLVWGTPWSYLSSGLTTTVAARSLLAMVPWKTSLGSEKDPRPRLVHFTSRTNGSDRPAWHRAKTLATREGAPLWGQFRCALLPYDEEGDLVKRFGVWGGWWPPVLFLTPQGEEIDRYSGG